MLPNGETEVWPYLLREVLDLMLSGNEEKYDVTNMRNIFTSVSFKHRHTLLSYGPEKTLLYQAVDFGLHDIVRFLVTECGASTDKGILKSFWNFPPLFCAVKNGNLAMVELLVSLGANVNGPTSNGCTVVNEACEFGKLSIARFLISKGADVYTNGHVMRSGQSLDYLKSAVQLGWDIDCTDDMGRNPLIFAADMKRYDIISYLMEHKVDVLKRDKRGNNALCVAIRKNDKRLMEYLSENVFPPAEVIKSFEIQGGKMAVRQNYIEAFQYWKEAFDLREKYSLPRDYPEIRTFWKYKLFQNKDDLLTRKFDTKQLIFEALNIFLCVMTPFHGFCIDAAIKISQLFHHDTYVSNELLIDIFRLNWEIPDPLSSYLHAIFHTMISLHSNTESKPFDAEKAIAQIEIYMDFIEEKVWKVLLKPEKNDVEETEKYGNVIYILITFIKLVLDSGPSLEQSNYLLVRLKNMIIKEKSRHLPTTLLHQAVKLDLHFGVKILIQCGADINAMDDQKNTPLHHVGFSLHDNKHQIASFLVKYGSDVDAVNTFKDDARRTLTKHGILKNSLDQVSLKCLAARTISKNQVVVFEEDCPPDIIPIIKRHGGMVHVRKETK